MEEKVKETLEAWKELPDFDELVTAVTDLVLNELDHLNFTLTQKTDL